MVMKMKPYQKSIRDGIEDFLCPFTDMYITQGSNGQFSHQGIMAHDVRGANSGVRCLIYAPFDMICKKIYPSSGQAMYQSKNNVRCANGYIGKVTFMVAHDNTMDSWVGREFSQGEPFFQMGNAGNATGVHSHIEISQSDDTTWKKNEYGIYRFNNEYDPSECYFIDDTNIIEGFGLNWKTTADVPIKEKVVPNVERDEYKNQIEVKIDNLNVRKEPSLNSERIDFAKQGFYDYSDIVEADGYTWYKIADNQWIAYNEEWETVYPAKEKEEFIQLKVLDKKDGYVLVDLGQIWIKEKEN